MLNPNDRVVMISGASRGIGAAIAQRLADEGYCLSLGLRDPAKAGIPINDRCIATPYDARDPESAKRWVSATVEQFGRIDALVNNAGIALRFSIEDGDEEALDDMWQVNVKAPLRLVRAALPYLRKCGQGRVIQVASLQGKRVARNNHGYAMTKFAALALTHSIRRIGWEDGVRATALCPNFVATDLTSGMKGLEASEMTSPEDLASLVACVLKLPNTASVAELLVNCRFEDAF